MCGSRNAPILECEQRHLTGGSRLDSKLRAHTEERTLAWLEAALDHAHSHGQQLALAYLETVMEDMVLAEEMATRRTSCVDSAATPASLVTS